MMLALSMFVSAVIPAKSHALVGAVVAVPTVVAVGAITAGAGGVGLVSAILYGDRRGAGRYDGLLLGLASYVVIAVGLVILDDNSQGIAFGELDETKAVALGINAEEAAAYNSELEEINAAKQSIEMEVVKMEEPSAEKAHALWQEMRGNISPAAYSAMEKVSAEFVKNLK